MTHDQIDLAVEWGKQVLAIAVAFLAVLPKLFPTSTNVFKRIVFIVAAWLLFASIVFGLLHMQAAVSADCAPAPNAAVCDEQNLNFLETMGLLQLVTFVVACAAAAVLSSVQVLERTGPQATVGPTDWIVALRDSKLVESHALIVAQAVQATVGVPRQIASEASTPMPADPTPAHDATAGAREGRGTDLAAAYTGAGAAEPAAASADKATQ